MRRVSWDETSILRKFSISKYFKRTLLPNTQPNLLLILLSYYERGQFFNGNRWIPKLIPKLIGPIDPEQPDPIETEGPCKEFPVIKSRIDG
jgi:hypothetical protein